MAAEPSTRFAVKGCRSCNQRRINCDRTLPLCMKCSKKGLECPGYGVRYRWTNAVASRGRFKGLRTPDQLLTAQSQSEHAPASNPSSDNLPRDQEGEDMTTAQFESLSGPVVDELLQHYATVIAPVMVWLDSEQNMYRHLVIALSKTQPVLRYAILAISAAHMGHEFELDAQFSRTACETAVSMITERIRQLAETPLEVRRGSLNDSTGTNEAVLAAMLILSNHSLLDSDLFLARFHRHAARILMKTVPDVGPSNNDLFVFLTNQAAIIDVLACTTSFREDHMQHAIVPDFRQGPVLFGRFLSIIQDITVQSMAPKKHDVPSGPLSIGQLQEEFELAEGSTLLLAGPPIVPRSEAFKQDFIRLVKVYHHAGIIYAFKRLRILGAEGLLEYHSAKLFSTFEQFNNLVMFLFNLSWPVFMAGICSCGNQKRMHTVRSLCHMLTAHNRSGHYANLGIFLEELWESPHQDWALTAQEWENRDAPLMAV